MDATIVSTEWLAGLLDQPGIRIADASWYLPDAKRNPAADYMQLRIPGAVFFDIDAISDRNTNLPHMLPDAVSFASAMRRLGIGDADFVVLYDGAGIYSSPRAWWMLRAMGHDRAAVLDGGLPKWVRENRPTESGEPGAPPPSHFGAHLCPGLIRNFEAMRSNVRSGAGQIVDARSPGRFHGEEPEPRPGVRPGHIPGSRNIHYAKLVAPGGTLRSDGELRQIFAEAGIELARPVVTTCGSGVTAAIVALALQKAGAREIALYDGSWSEWGAHEDAPVATGPA